MKALFVTVALGVGSLLAIDAFAADPPAGATALCKDGTYYTGTAHKGACKGHQGVKDWMDKTTDSTAASTATTATESTATKTKSKAKTKSDDTAAAAAPAATAPAAATTSSTTSMSKPATTTTTKTPTPASQITQKAGGGPGMVWVNSSSKVYHCPGDEWYGKTKEGSYMTEAAAKAAGNHASHSKECGS